MCLSAHISQKLHVQISQNFRYVLPVAMTQSLHTSVFVNDVMCSHIRASGPKNEALHYVSSSSPGVIIIA